MSINKLVLNKKKKNKRLNPIKYCDKWILFLTIGLTLYGCVAIVSATMGTAAGSFSLLWSTIIKQVAFVIVGFVLMFCSIAFFKVKFLDDRNFLAILILAMFIFLALPLGFTDSNGAHAWIPLGPMSIQPSEFAKVGIILLVACYMGNKDKVPFKAFNSLYHSTVMYVLAFVVIVAVFQGDFGSGMVMFCIAFICMFVPQSKRLKNIHKTMVIGVIVAVVVASTILFFDIGETIVDVFFGFLKPYQKARIFSAKNPFVDQYDTGYQLINGLVAFASGGFGGTGFGNSVRKFTNFPAANTDYILSIIVEESGFKLYILIFFVYAAIVYLLFNYAIKIKNEKARIILVGVASFIFVHFLFNVGGVTGLIPLTGVPLLLLSSGGSSAASILLGLGIAQAVISQYKMGEIK